jgi:hypothetical protein
MEKSICNFKQVPFCRVLVITVTYLFHRSIYFNGFSDRPFNFITLIRVLHKQPDHTNGVHRILVWNKVRPILWFNEILSPCRIFRQYTLVIYYFYHRCHCVFASQVLRTNHFVVMRFTFSVTLRTFDYLLCLYATFGCGLILWCLLNKVVLFLSLFLLLN